MLARIWRNRNTLMVLVGMSNGAATLESLAAPQKVKQSYRITQQFNFQVYGLC